MATVTTFHTYDLAGKKLSFANWISNLSPTETPFTSMTGKEAINQTTYQWQTDTLQAVDKANAVVEGSKPSESNPIMTSVHTNNTQILRKVVQVSDTANVVAAYGRGKEVQYQMEKAGLEIKRDLEMAFLQQVAAVDGDATTPRKFAGFEGLVAAKALADVDTGAVVHQALSLSADNIFKLTYNLYLANSKASIIMYHPKHATFFASLMEGATGSARYKMFDNLDTKLNFEVDTIIDPLGQRFALIPNRHMPEGKIFFFSPADWTQMVFRAPQRIKLAKEGSYEKWMIEMEVGLRHRNPFASGIMDVGGGNPNSGNGINPTAVTFTGGGISAGSVLAINGASPVTLTMNLTPANADPELVTFQPHVREIANIVKNGDGTVTITPLLNGPNYILAVDQGYHTIGFIDSTVTGMPDYYFTALAASGATTFFNSSYKMEVIATVGTPTVVNIDTAPNAGVPLPGLTATIPPAGQATATVSVSGQTLTVTPVAKGSTTMTVSAKGKSVDIVVTVLAPTDKYVIGKKIESKAQGATVSFSELFIVGNGAAAADFDFTMYDAAKGTVTAAGDLTISATATGGAEVVATAKSGVTVYGSPASGMVQSVTPTP